MADQVIMGNCIISFLDETFFKNACPELYFALKLSRQLLIWHLSEWNEVKMSCPVSKMHEHLSGLNISVACMQCVNTVWCGSY